MTLEPSASDHTPVAADPIYGCGPYATGTWLTDRLPHLDGFRPLLPGGPDKRPTVGNDWPDHPGFTIQALQAAQPATICWHIGAPGCPYIALDIDGPKVIAWLKSHRLDPLAADTWRIVRTGNLGRLKLVFRVTPEQKALLVAGGKEVRIAAGEEGEKDPGEEFALYGRPGTQIVVLGNHHAKGTAAGGTTTWIHDDQYAWARRLPADAAPIPEDWLAFLIGVFTGDRPLAPPKRRKLSAPNPKAPRHYRATSRCWRNSDERDPCPICGRTHTGKCSIHTDGQAAWCSHGTTCSAPDCSAPGEVITGHDGQRWGYVRTEEQDPMGERSLFVIDKPLPAPQPAEPPEDADPGAPFDLRAVLERRVTGNGHKAPQGLAAAPTDEEERAEVAEALQLSERLAAGRAMFSLHHLLPHDLADAAFVVMAAAQPDALSALLPLLGGYSGLHKLGTRVRPSASKSVPTNLYVCGLGVTGTAKTSFLENLVQAPAAEIRADAAASNARNEKDWETNNTGKKKDEKAPKPLPIFPHLTGYTPEALDRQLSASEVLGLGLLVVREEASGLFGSIDQYKAAGRGGSGDAQLLECFDGSPKAEIRINDSPRSYERCHLSVYTGAQPAIVRALINGTDATGKFARFLFVRLPHRPLDLDADNPTPEAMARFQEAMATLRRYAGAIYREPPREYLMDPRGRELFVAWFRRHQKRALLPGTPCTIGAMLNKAAAHALRLMGNLHLCRIAAGEVEPAAAIPTETINNALAIVDQLMAETEAFHEAGGDGVTELARRIHAMSFDAKAAVDREAVRNGSGKDIRKACTSAAFSAAIETLQLLGYGEISGRSYLATREMAA